MNIYRWFKGLFEGVFKKLLGCKPVNSPNIIDYGHGYIGRRLLDGRYALECKGVGVSLDAKGFNCHRGTPSYHLCIAPSAKAMNEAAKRTMSNHGVGAQ